MDYLTFWDIKLQRPNVVPAFQLGLYATNSRLKLIQIEYAAHCNYNWSMT